MTYVAGIVFPKSFVKNEDIEVCKRASVINDTSAMKSEVKEINPKNPSAFFSAIIVFIKNENFSRLVYRSRSKKMNTVASKTYKRTIAPTTSVPCMISESKKLAITISGKSVVMVMILALRSTFSSFSSSIPSKRALGLTRSVLRILGIYEASVVANESSSVIINASVTLGSGNVTVYPMLTRSCTKAKIKSEAMKPSKDETITTYERERKSVVVNLSRVKPRASSVANDFRNKVRR